MAQLQLVKNTIEELQVTVVDTSGAIDDMAPLTPQFYVNDMLGAPILTVDDPVTIVGMILFCLVDTTGVAFVPGQYRLYVTWTDGTETPILGPVNFFVI